MSLDDINAVKEEIVRIIEYSKQHIRNKLIAEFLVDLNRAYKKQSTGLCWSAVKKAIEKWEARQNAP